MQPAPYSLSINYSSTSSGDGRYEFTNGTTDFAVSDIAYGLGNTDTTPPSFPYIYVPITAGGIAFMYNIPGLTKTLQLTSYTTCAILTGGITNWNDRHIAAANPGVTLPNLPIRPVTESDPAGTNFVLEEWCIAEQPALWAAFANYEQQHCRATRSSIMRQPARIRSGRRCPTASTPTRPPRWPATWRPTRAPSAGCSSSTRPTPGFGKGDPAKGGGVGEERQR